MISNEGDTKSGEPQSDHEQKPDPSDNEQQGDSDEDQDQQNQDDPLFHAVHIFDECPKHFETPKSEVDFDLVSKNDRDCVLQKYHTSV